MNTIHQLEQRDVGQAADASGPVNSLSSLRRGQGGVVAGVESIGDRAVCRRLYDLGFAPGRSVTVIRRSLSGGRGVYRVSGSDIALRRQQADLIKVELS